MPVSLGERSDQMIDVVAGTRPNLIKAAAIFAAFKKRGVEDVRFVYTSQHYDRNLFEEIREQLVLPEPDIVFPRPESSLSVLSDVFQAYRELLSKSPPKLTMVFGDVTSSLACTLAARYEQIPVAHIEAGLRSFNWTMPEEINRVAIDSVATHAFVTSEVARQNLRTHDNFAGHVYFVGNTMIDTLRASGFVRRPQNRRAIDQSSKPLLVCTFHRPENVDDPKRLSEIVDLLGHLSKYFSVVFPVHPRTELHLNQMGLKLPQGVMRPPMPYLEFLSLVAQSVAVVTDSGGISEETTILGVPCLTLRSQTERPETVTSGTNLLVGDQLSLVPALLRRIVRGDWKTGSSPPLWDGRAGDRIVQILFDLGFVN